MDNLQGSILRVKLRYLGEWIEARRRNAALYNQLLSNGCVTIPCEMRYAHHVYHLYAVRSIHRDALQQKLSRHGVHTGIHYPVPVHLQPAYADLGHRAGDFPYSERAAREVLSLPMFAELSSVQQERVALAFS
jgi:dTDP-4-amino-4,6-dideoxygalactose transaminase